MGSTTHIQVSHDAVCPEISPVHCEELGGLPEHTHHQTMAMTRANGTIVAGLGKGWQIKGELPIDHKHLTIEYQDKQGRPYDPPYAGIHHRNETLIGVGDGRLHVEYFHKTDQGWVIGGSLGATIPIGKIEKDPYSLAEQSLQHQHIQMGAGTVDPIISLSALYSGHQWGLFSRINGRVPLYENRNHYKPVRSLALSIGPTYRVTSKLMVMATADVLNESQAYWGDRPDPMSGRTAIIGAAGAVYRFNTTVALMAQGRVSALQWSVSDQIVQPFVGVLGVSITPQKD